LSLAAVFLADQGGAKTHLIVVQRDLTTLIARKNKIGDMYRGGRTLLNQAARKNEAKEGEETVRRDLLGHGY
jgi:hypothetical protein